MPLFGGKHKTPHELVKTVKESLNTLTLVVDSKDEKKNAKVLEELSKSLDAMKVMLCGTGDHEPQAETTAQLAHEICNTHLILLLIENMTLIDFEGRKDTVMIFNNLLRRQLGTRFPTVDHICQNRDILTALMTGYKNQELALNCGLMLRECFRHEELARVIMLSEDFYLFFDFVEVSTFDISSDAFLTFKELLTKHKMLSAEFLEANYERVFEKYHKLLNSDNYVTRRQALKLLGELLLDRRNFTIMTRYIGQPDNLKLMMNLLKENSKNIQFEAFHVFKVFVANPDKPRPIQEILLRNKDRLVEFLTKFHTDRSDDEQFNDEKAYLIKQIKDLKPLEPPPTSKSPPPLIDQEPTGGAAAGVKTTPSPTSLSESEKSMASGVGRASEQHLPSSTTVPPASEATKTAPPVVGSSS